jgi:hypothetical protein
MGQQTRRGIATVESVSSALATLGIDLKPLKAKRWDRETSLRVLKLATKRAYRYKALDTHPDRFPHKAEEFRKATEARDVLDSLQPQELDVFLGEFVPGEKVVKPNKRERKTVSLTIVYHLPIVGW